MKASFLTKNQAPEHSEFQSRIHGYQVTNLSPNGHISSKTNGPYRASKMSKMCNILVYIMVFEGGVSNGDSLRTCRSML